MSNHLFKTLHNGHAITVNLGWDRPMGHFFLVIPKPVELLDTDPDADDDGEFDGDFLYSNLYERNPFGLDLDYFRGVLHRLGITLPESMYVEVLADRRNNVGNRLVTHQADGTFSEHPI